MRFIRNIPRGALALVVVPGLPWYIIARIISDRQHSALLLFVLGWALSSLGVAGAACLIASCTPSDKSREANLVNELYGVFAIFLFVMALVAFPFWMAVTGTLGLIGGSILLCAYAAAAAGYVLGFFVILDIHVRERWISWKVKDKLGRLRRAS